MYATIPAISCIPYSPRSTCEKLEREKLFCTSEMWMKPRGSKNRANPLLNVSGEEAKAHQGVTRP